MTVPGDILKESAVPKKACEVISKRYPGKDCFKTLDYLVGTPFESPRILGAVVHDVLYGLNYAGT